MRPTQVYEGQIVGEHCRDNDLGVNICLEKKLTNMRASGSDKSGILKPPRQIESGSCRLEYIEEGTSFVEITPGSSPAAKAVPQGERPQEGGPGRRGVTRSVTSCLLCHAHGFAWACVGLCCSIRR